MLPPEVTDQPPGALAWYTKGVGYLSPNPVTGGTPPNESDAAARAGAVARPPSFDDQDWFPTDGATIHIGASMQWDPASQYIFSRVTTKVQIRYHSATCYLKVWWDQVTYNQGPGRRDSSGTVIPTGGLDVVEVDRSAQSWTASPSASGGFCLPNPSTFDPADDSTWQAEEIATIDAPSPGVLVDDPTDLSGSSIKYYSIEKVRYSFLPGYTPPDDGSANGFPI